MQVQAGRTPRHANSKRDSAQRLAFTLIDTLIKLLVLFATIAVLIALLPPAVLLWMGVLNWSILRRNTRPVSIDDFTDGTSTTLLSAELAGRPDLGQRGVKKVAASPCCRGSLIEAKPNPVPINTNSGGCWSCLDNRWNELIDHFGPWSPCWPSAAAERQGTIRRWTSN